MAHSTKRAREARRGTKADETALADDKAVALEPIEAAAPSPSSRTLEVPTPSRKLDRVFTVVEVILCVVPFVAVGLIVSGASIAGQELSAYLRDNGVVLVEFIAAMMQALVAWMLRIVHDHHVRGDGGYAVANLIALVCGELLLQNIAGMAGCAFILWRLWKTDARDLMPWARERGVGGALFDLSGALVVIVMGAICTFAFARLSAAGLVPTL